MPWYQALPIIGSALTLGILFFTQPNSESRPLALTLLVGALMTISIGCAIKDVLDSFYLAVWLASS